MGEFFDDEVVSTLTAEEWHDSQFSETGELGEDYGYASRQTRDTFQLRDRAEPTPTPVTFVARPGAEKFAQRRKAECMKPVYAKLFAAVDAGEARKAQNRTYQERQAQNQLELSSRAVCDVLCKVKDQCLEFAIANGLSSTWGGLSTHSRSVLVNKNASNGVDQTTV